MAATPERSLDCPRTGKGPVEDGEENIEGPPSKPARRLPSLFFALPQELRDEIFSWAFANSAVSSCYKLRFAGFALLAYPLQIARTSVLNSLSYHDGLPAWIFASKRMLTEGVESFVRGRHFEIDPSSTFGDFDFTGGPKLRPSIALDRYENSILAKSIRRLRLPDATNQTCFFAASQNLKLPSVDSKALHTLMALRGAEKRRLSLKMDWHYDLFAPVSYEEPMLLSTVLNNLQGRAAEVSITIKLTVKRPVEIANFYDPDDVEEPWYDQAWPKFYQERLLEQAELWARRLVGDELGSKIRCEVGQNKVIKRSYNWGETHWKTLKVDRPEVI